MGKHLEMLEGFVKECSPSLQKFVVQTMGLIIAPSYIDWRGLEPLEEDDFLTALQKSERLRKTPMNALPGYTKPTWESIKNAILEHGKGEMLEPFLSTSLVLAVDESLRYYADEEVAEQGILNNQTLIKYLEAQKSADSSENAKEYDDQIRFSQELIDTCHSRVTERRALLSEWRNIIGNRWKDRRLYGMWEDVEEYDL